MKKNLFKLLIASSLIVTLSIPMLAKAEVSNSVLNKTNIETIEKNITHLLTSRANIMNKNGENNFKSSAFIDEKNNLLEENQRKLIADFRETLKSMGEEYASIDVDINIKEINEINENKIEVLASEETKLFINAEENSGYSADHIFIYEYQNDEWVLKENRQLDPTGLLPISQAEDFVYKDPNKIEVISDEISIEPLVRDAADKPASIERPRNVEEKDLNSEKSISPEPKLNYSAMGSYLERHYNNPNTAYRNFDGKGGDCTNFASQALRAGGWSQISGLYTSPKYWWYNSANQTYSWTSVEHLSSFGRNRGRFTNLSNVWSLGVGDVLQVTNKGSSTKVHTMMVSYRSSSGTPYFTYRSPSRYRRSMNQVIADWSGGSFYAYRT